MPPLLLITALTAHPAFAQKNKSVDRGSTEQKSDIKTASQPTTVRSYNEPKSQPVYYNEPAQPTRSYEEPTTVTYDQPNTFSGSTSSSGAVNDAGTRNSNSQSWPAYQYVEEPSSAARPTQTQKSGSGSNQTKADKKDVGGVKTVRDATAGSQIAMDSVKSAEAQLNLLLKDPHWIDPAYVVQVQAQLQIMENQLPQLSGSDHDHCQAIWVGQTAIVADFIAYWDMLVNYQSYFEMKYLFLNEINPTFGNKENAKVIRDSLFGLPNGGWEYLALVNAWNPDEITLEMGNAYSFSWEVGKDPNFIELDQFFNGFMNSRLRKELDISIAELFLMSDSLASSDEVNSTYILENAYFLLRSCDLLSQHDRYYTAQLIALDEKYPGLPKLVSENLPLAAPYFNSIPMR